MTEFTTPRQRLIRILVYEGTPTFIAEAIANRGVKGSVILPQGIIKEAIVGDFLESVITKEVEKQND